MEDMKRSESPRRRLNRELVRMAHCLAEVGPSVNEIARRTGQYKETVRYRYHRFFLDKGITIQAVPSYTKLGFKRLIIIAKLARSSEASAESIFMELCEYCYLHSFTRVLLTGRYVIHVAVPSELAGRCSAVYRSLHESGLFTEMEILEFDEMRNPPMKPELFDFVRGTWSFDWDSVRGNDLELPVSVRPKVERYDRVDLLILKELDIDASRTLVKMAENVKVSLNALEFHYRDHVNARGLIKGYRLVWQGTKYDREQRKVLSRKEFYIELTILLKGGTREEVVELMLLLNKTPFLWSEAYGASYCAEVFLPHYAYEGFLEYIDEFATSAGEKLSIFVMDQSRAMRFVLQYDLFDAVSRKWLLDPHAIPKALESLAAITGKERRLGENESKKLLNS
jgi:DNA-binding Lrp family transcriptional regulator